jgi:hypothetical protein
MEAKSIPYNELKKVTKLLNAELRSDEQVKMNQTKEEMIKQFSSAVVTLHEAGRTFDNNILKFYNKHIVGEEAPEAPEETATTATATATTTAKPKAKKVPGVLDTIFQVISKKGPVGKDKILKVLVKRFPDRDEKAMKSTINCQIGGKVRPTRLEKSRKATFVIKDGLYSVKEA